LLLPLAIVLHGTHPTAVAVHVEVAVLVVALVLHRLLHLRCVVGSGMKTKKELSEPKCIRKVALGDLETIQVQ
jgi:hypothetical protein